MTIDRRSGVADACPRGGEHHWAMGDWHRDLGRTLLGRGASAADVCLRCGGIRDGGRVHRGDVEEMRARLQELAASERGDRLLREARACRDAELVVEVMTERDH